MSMKNLFVLVCFSIVCFFSECLLPCLAMARSPNVVVILTDDQGWGDLSVNGNTNLATPNIDSLSKTFMFARSALPLGRSF